MSEFMDLNRQLWDEWTDVHEGSAFYDLEGFLQGGIRLRDYELAEMGELVGKTRGVLGWLPDIEAWGRVAARFVKPGGIFYITEGHPVAMAFAEDLPLRPLYPYWSNPEPLAFDTKGSYADPEAEVRTPREYGWDHSLGEIVQSLIDAGLTIELLRERPFADWDMGFTEQHEDGFWYLPEGVEGELPLSFSLRAGKR